MLFWFFANQVYPCFLLPQPHGSSSPKSLFVLLKSLRQLVNLENKLCFFRKLRRKSFKIQVKIEEK